MEAPIKIWKHVQPQSQVSSFQV